MHPARAAWSTVRHSILIAVGLATFLPTLGVTAVPTTSAASAALAASGMAAAAAVSTASSASAVSTAPARSAGTADDPINALQSTLQQRYPDVKIEGVQSSPIPGLYEVFAGGRVVYADKAGDYLLLGKLVDTKTRHDLSAEHLDIHNAIDFQKLPFDRAIKIVKGDGHRRLAVFADPDCPYCQQLEKEMRSITDVTVYVFLFPLNDVHPNAIAHARAIWCSPDRSSAWTDWMVDHKQPSGSTCDGDPLTEIQTLATDLRIASTPTLFLESGRRISTALPADQLQTLLGSAPVSATQHGPKVANTSPLSSR